MLDLLKQDIESGYISCRKHPTADLYIYNYTKKAQYDWYWTPATMVARGLILDGQGNVVARPFKKFFTIEQLETLRNSVHNLYGIKYKDIWNMPFKTYDKLDGSLGILYHIGDVPYMATRGSFESPQAAIGTELLHEYVRKGVTFDKDKTYLFEIIYPENRVVVNYGSEKCIKLLAVIDNATGLDVDIHTADDEFTNRFKGLDRVKEYPINTIAELELELQKEYNNREGFVLVFENGFRIKFKYDEYKRLHRVLTGVTEKDIWLMLRNGESLDSLLERVPDEFYDWVEQTEKLLRFNYINIYHDADIVLYHCTKEKLSRKEVAIKYKDYQYLGIVFAMLDDKRDYKDMIWKLCKPITKTCFKINEGD